ncbi:glutaredoxin family protein [Rhodococcus sp. NPDC056743]|uniref:glutaredoxin family protein n=1 Tax=Rhodococcus sp. NPDC056743 TaxID=3345934 RepID=UPI0036719A79
MKVTVFTKPGCPPCDATKTKLDKHGVEYEVCDVITDPEAKARVQELGYLSTPVVECGDTHWQGYSPDKCKALADSLAVMRPALDAELSQSAAECLEV